MFTNAICCKYLAAKNDDEINLLRLNDSDRWIVRGLALERSNIFRREAGYQRDSSVKLTEHHNIV